MCFYTKQSKEATVLEKRFKATFNEKNNYTPKEKINGFAHSKVAVITNEAKEIIQLFEWGLVPFWAKDKSFQKNTLNAKIETLNEKPSFKSVIKNRCIVLVDGFYEWQWQDEKGKKKKPYLLHFKNDALFALGGLWSVWTDKTNNETINTFTIITKEANELMAQIHNSKKRMPFIINQENEMRWLEKGEVDANEFELIAKEL